MNSKQRSRVLWSCRRGMLELDIIMTLFFYKQYEKLSDNDKELFIQLLENDDIDLFNWLINRKTPKPIKLQRILKLIWHNNLINKKL